MQPRPIRHRRGQIRTLLRVLRYRLVIPVFRSPHPPEHTARGVANGVFWALTPSVGVQSVAILVTWLVGRKVLGKDSSLLQAYIWAWVNNPLTMIPLYYLFYVTGLWFLGDDGTARGYDAFVALWEQDSAAGWWARVTDIGRAVGVPTTLGCIPYAAIGSGLSYRWAVGVVRRRKGRLHRTTQTDLRSA